MTCLTIYTDASVCGKTNVGGWGCWAKFGPGEKLEMSAAFKEPVVDSLDAEMKAIANSLKVAVKAFKPENCVIVVTTDSQMAIDWIRGTIRPCKMKKRANAFRREVVATIKSSVPSGCELRIKKVKAHSKNDGARSYVNGVVDKAAKAQMYKARERSAA